jgi:hypothetical protein
LAYGGKGENIIFDFIFEGRGGGYGFWTDFSQNVLDDLIIGDVCDVHEVLRNCDVLDI